MPHAPTTCCGKATVSVRSRGPFDAPLQRSQESGLAWPHGRDCDGHWGRLRRAAPHGGGGAYREARRRPVRRTRRSAGDAAGPVAPRREGSGPARATAARHGGRGFAAARRRARGTGGRARGGAPRGSARRRSGAAGRGVARAEGGARGRNRAPAGRTRGRVAAPGGGSLACAGRGANRGARMHLRFWRGVRLRTRGSVPRPTARCSPVARPHYAEGLNRLPIRSGAHRSAASALAASGTRRRGPAGTASPSSMPAEDRRLVGGGLRGRDHAAGDRPTPCPSPSSSDHPGAGKVSAADGRMEQP